MRFSRKLPLLGILCTVAIVSTLSSGANNRAEQVPAPHSTTDAVDPDFAGFSQAHPLSPRMEEIRGAFAREKESLLTLQSQLDAVGTDADALRLIDEIRQVKLQTQVDILHIQARHARLAGNEEAALRIEDALKGMDAPTPPPVRQQRSAPDAPSGQ